MKPSPPRTPPPLTEEQLMEKWRQEHSKTMTPVFEELGPQLKVIRNQLNNLSLKKSAPKLRRGGRSKKLDKLEASPLALPPHNLASKAGKTVYPVLVGEVSGLYKAKSLGIAPITLDLHGYIRTAAIQKLNEMLPIWVDTAMKGEYPWVIPVDIICGGGSQILSEVVQNWIRANRQVANRPKGS